MQSDDLDFCRLARRQERVAERLDKIVARFKISAAIFVGFGQPAYLNHVENKIAKVPALSNAPFLQQRHGHRTILGESEVTNASQQFLTGHVAQTATVLFADHFLSMVESLLDEQVGLAAVPRVFGRDQIQSFVKSNFVHFYGVADSTVCLAGWAVR